MMLVAPGAVALDVGGSIRGQQVTDGKRQGQLELYQAVAHLVVEGGEIIQPAGQVRAAVHPCAPHLRQHRAHDGFIHNIFHQRRAFQLHPPHQVLDCPSGIRIFRAGWHFHRLQVSFSGIICEWFWQTNNGLSVALLRQI